MSTTVNTEPIALGHPSYIEDAERWPLPMKCYMIRIKGLEVDKNYQRKLYPEHIKKIAREFNPIEFGAIIVNNRGETGRYYIMDGQQRVEALKIIGMAVAPALVVNVSDIKTEAVGYGGLNSGKTLGTFGRFHADLCAGDERAVLMNQAVEDLGMKITGYRGSKQVVSGTIGCVATLRNIYNQHGPGMIHNTLNFILQVWPDQPDAMTQGIVAGVCMYLTDPGVARFDMDRAKAAAGTRTALQVHQASLALAAKNSQSTGVNFAKTSCFRDVLRKLYKSQGKRRA